MFLSVSSAQVGANIVSGVGGRCPLAPLRLRAWRKRAEGAVSWFRRIKLGVELSVPSGDFAHLPRQWASTAPNADGTVGSEKWRTPKC